MKLEHINFEIKDNILQMYHGVNKHVVIPEGVTEISDEAFEDNKFIQVIEIPSTLKTIDAWLFYGCSYLQDIIINENNPYITKIGDCIYSKDKSILLLYPPYMKNTSFTIPSFVKEIGKTAFYRSSVEKVICNSGLQIISEGAFYSCTKLEKIYISDTVSEIGDEAFYNCERLSRINISSKVKVIKTSTFEGCSSLKEVELDR